MNVIDAEALLRELAASTTAANVEVGTDGQAPHNYAFLKLTSPADPDNFAVVSTPGDRWFELEVAGRFSTGTFSDLTPDGDVREQLERHLSAAIAYLDGRWSTGRSRIFGLPFVIVQADDGPVKLRLSMRETLKQVLRR